MVNVQPSEGHKLTLLLTETKHQTGLGDRTIFAHNILNVLQDSQTLSESSSSVSHIRSEVLDGLNIVCIYIKSTLGHNLDHIQISTEVTGQGFNEQ
ncbi:hypothetical protein HG531_010064 [Fusarium graminearum]|nr:hypothetical protein HG531_010064 [Fusarium graminearum]